jgi:hypothetical protein
VHAVACHPAEARLDRLDRGGGREEPFYVSFGEKQRQNG